VVANGIPNTEEASASAIAGRGMALRRHHFFSEVLEIGFCPDTKIQSQIFREKQNLFSTGG
jgi:hypothetical protein